MKGSKISSKPLLDISSQQRRKRRKVHQSIKLNQAKQIYNIKKILRKLSLVICLIIKFLQFNQLLSRKLRKKRNLKYQVHLKVRKLLQILDQLNKK
jgi:pentose-5-phosphate-3-epimerase